MHCSAEKLLSPQTLRTAASSAKRLSCGTTTPQSAVSASGLPPVSNVTTGVPQASASRFTVGNVSSRVGFKKISAVLYSAASSLRSAVRRTERTPGGNCRSICSLVPTRTIRKRSSSRFESAKNTSNPFLRPQSDATPRITNRSCRPFRSRKLPGVGWNTCRSMPFRITQISCPQRNECRICSAIHSEGATSVRSKASVRRRLASYSSALRSNSQLKCPRCGQCAQPVCHCAQPDII